MRRGGEGRLRGEGRRGKGKVRMGGEGRVRM